jgi:hypothetical protein
MSFATFLPTNVSLRGTGRSCSSAHHIASTNFGFFSCIFVAALIDLLLCLRTPLPFQEVASVPALQPWLHRFKDECMHRNFYLGSNSPSSTRSTNSPQESFHSKGLKKRIREQLGVIKFLEQMRDVVITRETERSLSTSSQNHWRSEGFHPTPELDRPAWEEAIGCLNSFTLRDPGIVSLLAYLFLHDFTSLLFRSGHPFRSWSLTVCFHFFHVPCFIFC